VEKQQNNRFPAQIGIALAAQGFEVVFSQEATPPIGLITVQGSVKSYRGKIHTVDLVLALFLWPLFLFWQEDLLS
jgi:hypothetical protein